VTSELAGLPRRLASIAYDALLLLAVMLLLTFALWALRGGREIEPGTIWFQLTLVALTMIFFCWFWTHGGQTLGMRAWRIEIQGADGGKLSWGTAIGRFWLAWLSALPAGLGFWWSWIDKDGLCWHDRLSDTRLVRTSKTS
jgi:uncharacterized RDD family membrane protein YckC